MIKGKYIFKSERLGFRNWQNSDLVEFASLNADEEVMEHFPKTLTTNEVEDLINKLKEQFSENGFTYYATEILDSQEFIGMIGLAFQNYETEFTPAIDIGWRLKKGAWGKGYATISICTINNTKSENVMKKIGMTKIGQFNHPQVPKNSKYEQHFCYEIINK